MPKTKSPRRGSRAAEILRSSLEDMRRNALRIKDPQAYADECRVIEMEEDRLLGVRRSRYGE